MPDAAPAPTRHPLLALPEDELRRRGQLLHRAGSVANADIYLLDQGGSNAANFLAAPSAADGQVGRGRRYPTPVASLAGDRQSPHPAKQNEEVSSIEDGPPVVLKTFRLRPWLVRVLFSRWTLAHECTILRLLQGLEGIPRFYGRVGRDAFLLEYVAGAGPVLSSRELPPAQYPSRQFFVRLRTLIQAMHARGVSHGDMRRRNVIQGPDETPFLIDFATAIAAHGAFSGLRRCLVAPFARADLFALAKLIDSYYPDLLTDAERQALCHIPWYLRAGRAFRRHVYRPFIKQKHWQERWARWRRR